MAYMSQENKKAKHAKLKAIMPKSWRWSLAVRHHSTIQLTIWSAPVDLLAEVKRCQLRRTNLSEVDRVEYEQRTLTHGQLNPYYLENQFDENLPLFQAIRAVLNEGNHDRSDAMTDYFDVGWYVDIDLGQWDKPFKVVQL